MSKVKDYNFISKINLDKETWKILAKIIRLWKLNPNNSAHEAKALQMVLLDEKLNSNKFNFRLCKNFQHFLFDFKSKFNFPINRSPKFTANNFLLT